MQETWVRSLGQDDPLEKEMATHSSILVWEIPWQVAVNGVAKSRTWLRDWTTRSLLAFCCRGLEALILSWEKKEVFKKKKKLRLIDPSACAVLTEMLEGRNGLLKMFSLCLFSCLLAIPCLSSEQASSYHVLILCPEIWWEVCPLGGTGLCVPCPPHEQGSHEWLWAAG